MIGPQDIRLCEHLLTQLYGHACGEIGSILLNRGRLPFGMLVRMSCLTANSVREALIVLIHHNCVNHSDTSVLTSTAGPSANPSGPEFFQVVPEEILTRVRFDQYINIAHQLYGVEAKYIIQCVLENGKITVGQLVAMLCSRHRTPIGSQKVPPMSETEQKNHTLKLSQIFKSNVLNLLAERYLKPAHPQHSINPLDLTLTWEKQMIAQLPGVPTPKDLKAVKERSADQLLAEQAREFEEMCSFDQRKRKVNGQTDFHNKKQKAHDIVLEDDMYVRVNHDRFNIKIRNSIFEQECLRSYNIEAALVMKAMLMLAEGKQKDCSDLASDPVSAQSIVIKLGDQSREMKGCFPARATNGQFNLKLKNTGDLVAEMLSIMSKQDDLGTSTSSAYVSGSLDKSLSELNPLPMVSEKKNNVLGGGSGSGGMREFKVEYGRYSVELRKALLGRIVREKFGIEAARVVRILLHKGRLDEKHLAKFAMMQLKDSRELCLKLSAANILELQEVPKTNDRQPSRSFYLFFIDFRKLIQTVSMMVRKAQTNVIVRIDQELKQRAILLAKVNRSDVYEDQEGLLSVWEKAELKKLKAVVEALEVAKLRLERDLFILNDLPWLT